MKKLLSIVMLIALLVAAVSCGGTTSTTTAEPTTTIPDGSNEYTPDYADEVRVLALKGPTGMGMANVWNESISDTDSKYKFTLFASPDLLKTEIVLGQYDIAALPTNVAAALYNSGKADLQVVAVNTLGVLHIVENGNAITDIQSLKGKTIHATGGGSTPEFILRYVLAQNGIDPDKDVTLDFSYTDHAELAGYVKSGAVKIAMLPEPNVTVALTGTDGVRAALDLTAEWKKISDFDVMQGCIVVRRDFAEQHPEQLAEFLDEYRASIEYVNEQPVVAAGVIANLQIIPSENLAKQAIPRCNIVYVDGEEMKESLSAFLNVLYEANASSIGGKNPDEGFYYKR